MIVFSPKAVTELGTVSSLSSLSNQSFPGTRRKSDRIGWLWPIPKGYTATPYSVLKGAACQIRAMGERSEVCVCVQCAVRCANVVWRQDVYSEEEEEEEYCDVGQNRMVQN